MTNSSPQPIADWEESLAHTSDTAEARLGYAIALAQAGSMREAIVVAQGALSLIASEPNPTRYELHRQLAEWTQDLSHYHEAARLALTLAAAQARLGCALARAGRVAEAVPHLQQALVIDPLDAAAKAALEQAQRDLGWNTTLPLTSIVILCCNAWPYTQRCLQTVFENTLAPYELILIDNGSTDETAERLESFARQPGPMRVVVKRLPENVGYPAGVNHGLALAEGEAVVLLNNDTLVSPFWLEGLWRAANDDPQVGLVGAVSNFAGGWQTIPVPDERPELAPAIALRRRLLHAGSRREVNNLSGFCLLIKRSVMRDLGGLDERFGLGFFDDDDLSRRARQAGFRLVVAEQVYIHHFGSRTFLELGIDTVQQLETNRQLYVEKWSALDRPPVSLTMIVRNEEANLAACLAPLQDLVREMVVVDTGSTDRTIEIAQSFGAKVVTFPWIDDFAAARNEALRHATQPWIFWMDADDRLDGNNAKQLRELFQTLKDEPAAYIVQCECVSNRPGVASTVVDHVRIFRNDPRHRWRYRVHEQILPALRQTETDIRWSKVRVHHVGYVDPDLRARKLQRDLKLLQQQLAEYPDDPFCLFNLGAVFQERRDWPQAIACLSRSLELSHPRDSIVRKLYAMISQCQLAIPDQPAALQTLVQARVLYPQDAELLFLEAGLRRELGEPALAETLYRELIHGQDAPHFASVDSGLRTHKAHHNLGLVLLDRRAVPQAREQFDEALRHQPEFLPSWLALAEVHRQQGNLEATEVALRRALEIDSNDSYAKAQLEHLLRHSGRWIEGVLGY